MYSTYVCTYACILIVENHYQTNLNRTSIGEVNSDHSGSQSPVRNVNHLGLHKDREDYNQCRSSASSRGQEEEGVERKD